MAGSASGAAQRVAAGARRVWRAHGALPREERLAAYTALGLFLTLFLPWYQETVIASGGKALQSTSVSLTGWGAFSFVEAAVLLVAAGVLTLLFQRGEGRAFHLPGGDGWVIMAAGLWTSVLVVWRIFDKQSTSVRGPGATTSGIEWGIFVALAVAALLAYAGSRIRAAHVPEPALPGDDGPRPPVPAPPRPGPGAPAAPGPASTPRAAPPARGQAGGEGLATLVRSVSANAAPAPASHPPASRPPASRPPASLPPASLPPASPPQASDPPNSPPPATRPPNSRPPASPPPNSSPPASRIPSSRPTGSRPPADQAPTRRRRPKLIPDPPGEDTPRSGATEPPTLPMQPKRPSE